MKFLLPLLLTCSVLAQTSLRSPAYVANLHPLAVAGGGGGNFGIVGFDSFYTNSVGTVATTTFHHTNSGVHRYVVVSVTLSDNTSKTVSSVVYSNASSGAQTMGQITNGLPNNTAGAGAIYLFGIIPTTTGDNVVHVLLSGSVDNAIISSAQSFTNVDQATPLGNRAYTFNDSGTATFTLSSAVNNLTVDAFCSGNANAPTSTPGGTGHSQKWYLPHDSGSGAGNSGAGITTGAASVSPSWTLNSDFWAHLGIDLKHD